MATNEDSVSVPKCYPFKSRLQEYAQKRALKVPVYETTKEGPSHEPFFRSTVVVNDVRYDSLLGFGTRKEAEQSAAEVALVEISKVVVVVGGGCGGGGGGGDADNKLFAHPIHESGLCKNLLQEYAQKMNYARPSYECQADHSAKGQPMFSCTLDLGGVRYVGSVAKTKKEAEIKVARTALLAIQTTNPDSPIGSLGKTQLTVLPSKKRKSESNACSDEKAKDKKPRRPNPKRKRWDKRRKLAEERGHDGRVIDPVNVEALPKDLMSEANQGDAARNGLAHCDSTVNQVNVEASPKDLASEAIQGDAARNGLAHCGSTINVDASPQDLMSEANQGDAARNGLGHFGSTVNQVNVEASPQDLMFEAIQGDAARNGLGHCGSTVNQVNVEALPQDLMSEANQGNVEKHDCAVITINLVNVEAASQDLVCEANQGIVGKHNCAIITVNPVEVEAASQDLVSEAVQSNDVKHALSHSASTDNPITVEASPKHLLPETTQDNGGGINGLVHCTSPVDVKHGSIGGDVEA